MPSAISSPELFPPLSPEAILAFQFSSWYPRFSHLSMKSTVIRPLSQEFKEYLDAEGVFLPEGSEDAPLQSSLSDHEDDDEHEDDQEERRKFSFPELDAKIREAVTKYGAVFPKLNFSSPRDAAWMLPASSPLKCVSPADVYLLLKSSDYVLHDLDPDRVFEETEPSSEADKAAYELELVLRKWYPVDHSRELRCFVRRETLIGITQRDPNYYDFWNERDTQEKVLEAIKSFWQQNIKGKWEATGGNYVFDFLLTRDLTRGHIVDFNPYAPKTDPLLFTYEELLERLNEAGSQSHFEPELRVIDSRSHPAATRNAPAHQHNMVPIEALAMSQGRTMQEFAQSWQEEIRRSAVESDEE
ncbi:D123-domain-containing protein [Panus rudis PR-1116 ss-1]|nr:D123-domain-containing protein [Panus rudis PR-1116 ss-1]